MKKLSLDQLEVENFASQLSEEELSNVKGGTSYPCAYDAAMLAAAAYGAYKAGSNDTTDNGTTVNDYSTTNNYNFGDERNTTFYGIDSVGADGTMYGVDSVKFSK